MFNTPEFLKCSEASPIQMLLDNLFQHSFKPSLFQNPQRIIVGTTSADNKLSSDTKLS